MLKYNTKEIREKLTIEQIEELMADLGGEPQRKDNVLICKTICHNGESHKLYYYDNSKHFQCYSECGTIGDVFELILKLHKNDKKVWYNKDGEEQYRDWELYDAVNYIVSYFNIEKSFDSSFMNYIENQYEQDEKIFNKYNKLSKNEEENNKITLEPIQKNIIKYFPQPHIEPWETENISYQTIKDFNIKYNPVSNGIIIPHFDINGNMIGIRERTLVKENEIYGKYLPSSIGGIMYNHALGFNLYGLNLCKENLKLSQTAIVFESEKSVMKYYTFVGKENNIAVACCGSSLTSHQIDLLRQCNVANIIIALDKQWKIYGDEEYKSWEKKFISIDKKCKDMKVSFLIDTEDILDYKDSPIDKDWDSFYKLYLNRKELK